MANINCGLMCDKTSFNRKDNRGEKEERKQKVNLREKLYWSS